MIIYIRPSGELAYRYGQAPQTVPTDECKEIITVEFDFEDGDDEAEIAKDIFGDLDGWIVDDNTCDCLPDEIREFDAAGTTIFITICGCGKNHISIGEK